MIFKSINLKYKKNRLKLILSLIIILLILVTESFHDKAKAAPFYTVQVTNVRFLYGIGRGPTHSPPNNISTYYRGYGMSGTMIELTAEMNVNGIPSAMYGDTVFTVQFTDGVTTKTFPVTIYSGQTIGTAVIPYNSSGASGFTVTSGTTAKWDYSVTSVTGIFIDPLKQIGLTPIGSIVSIPADVTIYWDNGDDPNDANFPPAAATDIVVNLTTSSVKLLWKPVSTATGATLNEDFYEYRVYYQELGATVWKVWNGSNDTSLRGLANNPVIPVLNDSTRHFSNGLKYTTIPSLKIFTKYNYYITAVDVFGNETAKPGVPYQVLTQPYSILIKISDGVTSYYDFTDLANPVSRTLKEANIRVEVHMVSSSTEPDFIRVWFTYNSITTDIVAGSNTINDSAFPLNSLFSVVAEKKGPNKWVAFLSTQTPVIKEGNEVRFIVEANFSGVPSFSDNDMTDENPNNNEWNFYIGSKPNFTPWPVRILNNVITSRNPVAYPSYYLTDDALVTIKVYDIKGRPVGTIVENEFRRGGQNIKEKGWTGVNKANKKLGVGLYYVHFEAKRSSDHKVILNKFKKVVIAY